MGGLRVVFSFAPVSGRGSFAVVLIAYPQMGKRWVWAGVACRMCHCLYGKRIKEQRKLVVT